MAIREREISQPQLRERDVESEGWKLPSYPYAFRPPTPAEDLQTRQQVVNETLKAAQSFLNTPEEYANIFGKHLYNKLNFAPQAKPGDVGTEIGDIASFMLPSLATGGIGAALSTIPRVNRLMQVGREFLQDRPMVNFVSRLLRGGGEAALFQKAKAPESSATDVAKAGGIGSTLTALAHATSSQNPLVNMLSKILLGSTLGYHYGGLPGVGGGVATAFMAPRMLKESGYTRQPVSHEVLTQPQNQRALQAYQAGQRIGDVPTPAEAFNHPLMGARQGMIGRTEQGAEAMAGYGEQRELNQQNAINNLLDEVFPRSTHHQNFIADLYRRSYQHTLPNNVMARLSNDPVINQAVNMVMNEPAYQKSLQGIAHNNFAFLDMVKRALNDMEQGALGENGKKTNRSRIYGDTARELVREMDNVAPIYGVARHHSNMEIIRNQMEFRLGKKPITGKNFYSEFLGNENKFNELLDDLRGNPDARNTLRDMRLAWRNLIGYDTAKSAAGMAQRHTSSAREGFQKFWNEYKEVLGAPRDIERANFIHDPHWWDQFDEAMRYTNRLQREERLAELIARGLTAGTLEYAKETASNKGKK